MESITCIKCGQLAAFPQIVKQPYVCLQCQTDQLESRPRTGGAKAVGSTGIVRRKAWMQRGILETERVEFLAVQFRWAWIGTWVKTPWGWKHAKNLEGTKFTPNDKIQP